MTLKFQVFGGEMLRQEGLDSGRGVRGGEALEEEVEVGAGFQAVGLGALQEGIQGGAGLGTAGRPLNSWSYPVSVDS